MLVWVCLEFGDTFDDTFDDTLLVCACLEFGDTLMTLLRKLCLFGPVMSLVRPFYETFEDTLFVWAG